jgi:hypothetical protein
MEKAAGEVNVSRELLNNGADTAELGEADAILPPARSYYISGTSLQRV